MKTQEVYCMDCATEVEAQWERNWDIGNGGYYICNQCGGDNVTDEYGYCDLCGQPQLAEELRTGPIYGHEVCVTCAQTAGEEFTALAESKIFRLHAPVWRDAVNLDYEGKEI